MGFDRERTEYRCGCYSEYYSHDSFFYNDPSRGGFVNVYGKHDHEDTARSDHFENIKAERVIGKAEDVLTTKMKPVSIIRYLKEKRMISEDDANRLLKYDSKSIMVKELFQIFIQRISLNQLRLTLIKTEQTQLLRYLADSEQNEDGSEDIDKKIRRKMRWCIHYNKSKFPTVDIRHFWRPEDASKAVATKRGVALNKFKWERLCYVMDLMIDFVPELNSGVICEFTHDNEMGILACKECNPFPETEDHPVPEAANDTLPLPPLLDNQEGNPEIANSIV
ncbi:unnamed protein product [Mytilus coruscus]|uniref:Uncharacterized protein n=1 Tax=Mytilus coruscus TaxID=42192 RepID=A0A6J8DH46_MYTCO|nr:unnamed protein product [Mytilus coruscus]